MKLEALQRRQTIFMFASGYGHFSADGREYVITDPFTPRPWINVISNGDYSVIASQTGGGFSFRGSAEQNRITRLFQDLVKDDWGKYFYIRDRSDGTFFSATLKPIMTGYDFYEVHVGIGYSKYIRVQDGLRVVLTIYVAPHDPMEFLALEIRNETKRDRSLDVTSYFEWAPGLAYDNHREFQKLFMDVEFDKKLNAMLVKKNVSGFPDKQGRHDNDPWPYTAFLAASEKIESWDGDKEAFLGNYRDEKDPLAMENGSLSGSGGRYADPVGAIRVNVDLRARETRTVVFTIGAVKDGEEDLTGLIAKTNAITASEELAKVHAFWSGLIDQDVVETPDKEFDLFTNVWSKYQAISCRLFARAAYYQISGGIGFRDQLQDSLIFLTSKPELTKRQILLHASKQFLAGDVEHWWLPFHSWGPRGNCSDDFLWLPFSVICYLEETGDYGILDVNVPYLDSPAGGTLYEHMRKAVEHSVSLTSPRGVPLMGDNDWNDGLSAVGCALKGESFWVSEFLYYILVRLEGIAEYEKDDAFLKLIRDKKTLTRKAFNEFAWDGEWFLQAVNDVGEPIGSKCSRAGKIYLNPQIWSVISGITDEERQRLAMKAVDERLFKRYGCLLLAPPYMEPDPEIGYITRYAPGVRENGGVYTHAAAWAVWAYCLLGKARSAYDAYIRLNPIHRSHDIDVFRSEPYVTPGNTDGPVSPTYGKGGWSWYTGSAQWLHNVAVSDILGIKGAIDRIVIRPCIPPAWNSFKYRRMFNDKKVEITVKRGPEERLAVNGKVRKGNEFLIEKDVPAYEVEYVFAEHEKGGEAK